MKNCWYNNVKRGWMMRFNLSVLGAVALAGVTSGTAMAEAAPKAEAARPARHYTTAETDIGTLLDDAEARAIVEKFIPGMTTNPQIDMARAMTLKAIQQYAADDVTDVRLAAIDAELAKLK